MATFAIAEANRLASDGENLQAIQIISRTLRDPLHAGDTELLKKRAALYQRLELHQYALVDLTRAAMLDHCDSLCYIGRSQCYRSLGFDQRTVVEYATMLKLDPVRANTYYSRGLLYHNLGNHTQAIEDYTMALYYRPTFQYAVYNRGLVYRDIGDLVKSHQDFAAAIEADPRDADAFNNRCYLNILFGQYQEAVEDATSALALVSTHLNALVNRGRAYQLLHQPEPAAADFNNAISIATSKLDTHNTPDYRVHHARGRAYRFLNQHLRAVEDLTTALVLCPKADCAIYLADRSYAFAEMGRYQECLSDLLAATQMRPLVIRPEATKELLRCARVSFEGDDDQMAPQSQVAHGQAISEIVQQVNKTADELAKGYLERTNVATPDNI